MWTPKRILLLAAGFGLFFMTYAVYAHFLGGIDGLPALPKEYWPSDADPLIGPTAGPGSEADRKLIQAFGLDCEEVKNRTIKLDIRDKGLVLAASEFTIEEDGRMKFSPFSIAIFGKDRGDSRFPEINTVRCSEAYLTFDRPISNPTEMGNRKIIGGELRGRRVVVDGKPTWGTIEITNNRRTPQTTDDIKVYISGERVFFEEKSHRVWTEGIVHLVDTMTAPNLTKIDGTGMELFLATSPIATSPKPAKKPKGENITGLKRIVLHHNVTMHLYVDSRSGFVGSSRPPSEGETGKKKSDKRQPIDSLKQPINKDHIMIDTEGEFAYDLPHEFATFDVPAAKLPPKQVLVMRVHEVEGDQKKLYDQLLCDHLKLWFRHKATARAGPTRDSLSGDREIDRARATRDSNREEIRDVTLTLDGENLEAYSADLFYRCATAAKGAETILKGDPQKPLILAVKDGNKIQAHQLWLVGAREKGGPQQATAQGPGHIEIADHNPNRKKDSWPIHIYWTDTLVSNKDGQLDLITLNKDARFLDKEHHQELRGNKIQVWMEPAEPPPVKASSSKAGLTPPTDRNTPRQRPRRLEAFENVFLTSPEMNISDADHLTVLFKDAPLTQQQLPGTLPNAPEKTSGKQPSAKAAGELAGQPGTKGQDKPAKKPINLWSKSVEAYVDRIGPKNELHRLVARGAVHVRQEGATPKDRGVDIKGETLELLHNVAGDLLVVLGDSRKSSSTDLAQLQLGDLDLMGPKVTIDQKENTSEVQGHGLMTMPSNTSFEGGKAAKPGTKLRVQWTKGMLFNGKDADFHGKVCAVQDNSQMLCESLQVTLDRVVSLKEGQKGGQSAKVEKLVADRNVSVEEKVFQDGKQIKFNKLVCSSLAMDNKDGPVNAAGPGVVYLLQYGSVDDNLAGPPPSNRGTRSGAKGKPKEELKLTRIEFEGRMFSNNKRTNRIAKFWDKVEVINAPCPSGNIDMPFNKDLPPERGMYLASEMLTVTTSPQSDGKTSQTMYAEKNVLARTPDNFAHAAKVTFEEAKDQVIFEGKIGSPATFYKIPQPGVDGQGFKGQKIFYNRRTKQHMGEGLQSIQYNSAE